MGDDEYYMEEEVMQAFEFLKYSLGFVLLWACIAFITKGFNLPKGAAIFTTGILFWGGYHMLVTDEQ